MLSLSAPPRPTPPVPYNNNYHLNQNIKTNPSSSQFHFYPSPITQPPLHLHPSSSLPPLNHNRLIFRCLAAAGPGPPPEDPNSSLANQEASLHGVAATLSRFQDSVQTFFAVLFWMSLFFWQCAWEGKNTNKDDRPRR